MTVCPTAPAALSGNLIVHLMMNHIVNLIENLMVNLIVNLIMNFIVNLVVHLESRQPNTNISNLKIKIRVAQNVGKVWISTEKNLLTLFHAISDNFSMGQKHTKHAYELPMAFGGPLAAIHPWRGY